MPKEHIIKNGKTIIKTTYTGNKVWLIFDGRARTKNTDDCAVYEAFSGPEETIEDALKALENDWDDGVLFEYDEVVDKEGKTYIVNQSLIR